MYSVVSKLNKIKHIENKKLSNKENIIEDNINTLNSKHRKKSTSNKSLLYIKDKGNTLIDRIDDFLLSYNNKATFNCKDVLVDSKNLLNNLEETKLKLNIIAKANSVKLTNNSLDVKSNKLPKININNDLKIKEELLTDNLNNVKSSKPNSKYSKKIKYIDNNNNMKKELQDIKINKKNNKTKKDKDTFITKIDYVVDEINTKSKKNLNKNNKYHSENIEFKDNKDFLSNINNHVKEIFANIDDSFYDTDTSKISNKDTNVYAIDAISTNSQEDSKVKEDKDYFINMIKEIDKLRSNNKQKESELEALIRITKHTSNNLDKHFKNINSLYSQANIPLKYKPYDSNISSIDEEEEDEMQLKNQKNNTLKKLDLSSKLKNKYCKDLNLNNSLDNIQKNTYKNNNDNPIILEKNLNKIKDSLLNVTGKVINYHENFKSAIDEIKQNNNYYYKSNTINNKNSKRKSIIKNVSNKKLYVKDEK